MITNTGTDVTLSNLIIQNGLGVGVYGGGGGISNSGTLNIIASTISGNRATTGTCKRYCLASSGGIFNQSQGTLTVINSTISGNSATIGGAIWNRIGTLAVNNSTISENSGASTVDSDAGYTATFQNSIVANNSSTVNCSGTVISDGYNLLSSDNTCNFIATGDMNNIDPKLGPLQNNGGPTQTMALLTGSPAIDAGNPSGCTDGKGHLLSTDQRGQPRPDKEDSGGCGMGAYERQTD